MLDLTPLRKALLSLKKAIEQPKNEFTRDSSIQRFEYSFELSWKFLKRYLEENQGLEESNIKNLFRIAAKQQLISSVEKWFEYHKARNLTSHTYNEETAEKIYLVVLQFYPDAMNLLARLEGLDV